MAVLVSPPGSTAVALVDDALVDLYVSDGWSLAPPVQGGAVKRPAVRK